MSTANIRDGAAPASRRDAANTVAQHVGLGVLVMALAWLSLAILGPGKVAPVWPANGVLLAVLLRAERRRWPGWLAVGFLGVVAGGVANGGRLSTTAALALCDVVEVSLSALAIRQFGGYPADLSRLRVVVVGGLAAILSAALGACGAWAVLGWVGRTNVIESVVTWTLANGLGQMIGAPTVLALSSLAGRRPQALKDWPWTILACAALLAAVVGVFTQSEHDLLFLIFAPLLAVVFQLEVRGAALGVMATSFLAVAFTVAGYGPMMLVQDDPVHRVILLQVFLLAAVLVSFPVAAVLSDRRKAQHGAEGSEARLQFLADHSRDIVVRIGLDMRDLQDRRIIDISSSCRTFGYAPEDLIGRRGRDVNHPDDQAQIDALVADMITRPPGQASAMREWRVRTQSGGWAWVEGHATLIPSSGGEASEFVIVMRDITERRVAAEALARSEARYRLLAENSGDLVLQFDADGTIIYASAAARRFGYRPEDLVGRAVFGMVHPDDVARAKQAMAAVVDPSSAEPVAVCEWRVRNVEGEYVWVEGNPSVSRDAEGRPITYTDSVRDITQRKALEADLQRKRAEAEASEAARRAAEAELREKLEELARVSRALSVGEFASSIAHEINQPIAAIVTNGDASLRWLANDPPNIEEARLAIGRTIRDASRAAGVISRTRAMLSKSPTIFSDIDINSCIDDVLLFTEAELKRNNVEVRRRGAASPTLVKGDRIQLQQVLLNLVRNGVEAMVDNKDRPRILSVTTTTNDNGEVVVLVSDTGCGLDATAAPRVFESFFTTKAGGVGLGLAISRSIIESHGGRLWAYPAKDGGATFQFTLPAASPV